MESLHQAETDLAESPEEYAKYANVIDILSSIDQRSNECEEKLVIYRTTVSSKFLPTLDFWKEWLMDAIISSLDVDSVIEKALASCPDMNLVIDILDYKISEYTKADGADDEGVIKAFEQSISICGIDILDGAVIWKRYTDFLISEHEILLEEIGDSCSASEAQEIQESKARLLKVFHRQLSLPLRGNDATLKELDYILERICVESDVSLINPSLLHQKYNEGAIKLGARMIYEDQIRNIETSLKSLSNSNKLHGDLMKQLEDCFRTYIRFEESDNQASRCQRLYERALLLLGDSAQMWKGFIDFALYSTKNLTLASAVSTRALKRVANDAYFWSLHLFISEQNGMAVDEMNAQIEKALQCSFSTMEDYFDIITFSCDYNRRLLETISGAPREAQTLTRAIDALRLSFANAKLLLKSHFAEWEYAYIYICKYHSQIEDNLISIVSDTLLNGSITGATAPSSRSASVWEDGIACLPSSYYMWSAYIEWAILNCDGDTVSKLFKKAYSSISGYTDQFGKDWINYERQRGTIKSLFAAMNKVKPTVTANDARAAEVTMSGSSYNAAKKRSVEATKREITDGAEYKVGAKRARVESKSNDVNNEETKDKTSTIFASKLPIEITEDEVRAIFNPKGAVIAVKVVRDKGSGKGRGQALVQFTTTAESKAALLLHKTDVKGALISVLPSKFPIIKPASSAETPAKYSAEPIASAHSENTLQPVKKLTSILAFKPRSMKMKI